MYILQHKSYSNTDMPLYTDENAYVNKLFNDLILSRNINTIKHALIYVFQTSKYQTSTVIVRNC